MLRARTDGRSRPARIGRLLSNKLRQVFTVFSLANYGLVGFAQPASAEIVPTGDPMLIAQAVAERPEIVTGASFVSTTQAPNLANAVVDSPLAGYPRSGTTFGLLTSGDPSYADDPNAPCTLPCGRENGGTPVRGDTDFDVTILKVDVNVAQDQNCLQVNFKFLSEEYGEFKEFGEFETDPFNDAFILEIDASTWNTKSGDITAPNTIAFFPFGDIISVKSSRPTSVSSTAAAGTTYNAATADLVARSPVTSGPHSVYFSIFDQTDNSFDSAVFLDNLRLTSEKPGQCESGTNYICTLTGTAGNDKLTGTPDNDVLCGQGGNDTLRGLDGNDVLAGGTGNDFLVPGNGNDLALGEVGGQDTVSFLGSPGPVNAILGNGMVTGAQGLDELVGVENAVGTNKSDTLKGSGAKNELKGKKGRDKLSGLRKSDRLIGGPGNDRLDGGAGVDFCLQGPGSGRVLSCEAP